MKLLVLAAGQGTRLRPLTDNIPKCMVPVNGIPILKIQLETAKRVNITDIHVVCGYREEVIQYPEITKHNNELYETTNMVESLFCAEAIMNDDLIISYGDIIYQDNVIQSLMNSALPISVVIDREWKRYWSARMENPLEDAETLKLNDDGTIQELGKKADSYDDIQGQYIGLIKFSKNVLPRIREFYHSLDRNITYDGRSFEQMYMTTFLQLLSDQVEPLNAVPVDNGWIEVDEPSDLDHVVFYDRA
jgi:L-glutamine-phosphate cytidylyltransferase